MKPAKKIIDTSRASLYSTVKQLKNYLINGMRPAPLPLGVVSFPPPSTVADVGRVMHHGEEIPPQFKYPFPIPPARLAMTVSEITDFVETFANRIYLCGYRGFEALGIERSMLAAMFESMVQMHAPAEMLEVVQHRHSKVNAQFDVIGDMQPDLFEQQNASQRETASASSDTSDVKPRLADEAGGDSDIVAHCDNPECGKEIPDNSRLACGDVEKIYCSIWCMSRVMKAKREATAGEFKETSEVETVKTPDTVAGGGDSEHHCPQCGAEVESPRFCNAVCHGSYIREAAERAGYSSGPL